MKVLIHSIILMILFGQVGCAAKSVKKDRKQSVKVSKLDSHEFIRSKLLKIKKK